MPRSDSAPDARPALLGLDADRFLETTHAAVAKAGEPRYRADQLRRWIFERTPDSFDEMLDLPRALRERLDADFVLHPLRYDLDQKSVDGTLKVLWRRSARHRESGPLESVMIPDGDRVTYCISTQSGCPVKCTFCATGHGGFTGNLDAAEIVDQVLQMRTRTGIAPTNLVYMGMGEPLLNYDAVARSLDILTHDSQVRFGARRITVSTVGVPDRIRQLGREFPQVKLALSLHAARDDLRDELIPLNRKHRLAEVLDAVREHGRVSGKKVTFEYVILPGVNDRDEDIVDIARRVRGIPSRINLIGFNPFEGAPYEKPRLASILGFRDRLAARFDGAITLRRSRGEDIQGACGQLSLARGHSGH